MEGEGAEEEIGIFSQYCTCGTEGVIFNIARPSYENCLMGSSAEKVAVLIRSYFDESAEEVVGQGYLVVAGYVFDRSGLRGIEREWSKLLKKYRLPYFHMTECNVDDPKPPNVFSHLEKPERIEAAREAIALARKYPLHGEAYVVRQEVYKEILEDDGFNCDAYSFLLWSALLQAAKWCSANRPDQPLSLFFEQGTKLRVERTTCFSLLARTMSFGETRVGRR